MPAKPCALAAGLVALTLGLAGCRTPGNPPSHPAAGEYRDLIRRELDASVSALNTGILTVHYLDQGKLPATYAHVVLRQAGNDLRKVAQDLGEVTPPGGVANAHAALRAIAVRDEQLLDGLARHVGDRPARDRGRVRLMRDANRVDQKLSQTLDPP